jgi:hypothetical protein
MEKAKRIPEGLSGVDGMRLTPEPLKCRVLVAKTAPAADCRSTLVGFICKSLK